MDSKDDPAPLPFAGTLATGQTPADDPPPEAPAPRRSERPGASLLGTVVSERYRIDRLLGEGGMGAVYKAEHVHMRKHVAVKVLHPSMSRLPEMVARFEREAMAAGHIEHPNVATASDFGKLPDGSFFLVLEYVEGRSLREVLGGGRLDVSRALRVARQVASALERAHALGIVHRDLKPENVMVTDRDGDPDFVKVLDFGIAKVPVSALGGEVPQGAALTQMGAIFGTPDYMAPEQALGQAVDARADQYSLGVMLFEMLAGVVPFEHDNPATVLGMHVAVPPPTVTEKAGAAMPAEIEALVARLLAKDAGARFRDAAELGAALSTAIDHLSSTTSGRGDPSTLDRDASPWWTGRRIAVVAIAAGLTLIGLALVHGGSQAPPGAARPVAQVARRAEPRPATTNEHRDRERAAMAKGDVRAALAEAGRWLESDPGATNDPELAVDLRTLAQRPDDPARAVALLEAMGSPGVDALYDLVYGYPAGPATTLARQALVAPESLVRASPSLAVTMELRAAASCEKKHGLLPRARDLGDVRTLALLRDYQATSGCGLLQLRDCWACMHRDDSLAATTRAIEQRLRSE